MRGRKRQRKKWLKRNFIEIAPGLYIPSMPRRTIKSTFMSIGAYREICMYAGGADPFPEYSAGFPAWQEIAVDSGNGRTEYTFPVKGSK